MAEDQKPLTEPSASLEDVSGKNQVKQSDQANQNSSRLERFKTWYGERKKWTIPASILLVILILAAVPFTRYNIAGLVVKRDITIKVVDATANIPVSGATLSIGSASAQTDSNGTATLHHVKAGHHQIVLNKKYYQERSIDVLAPIFSRNSIPTVQLTATGRQVKITVANLVSKAVLADVTIKVAGITAKTDKTGSALVVLPADEPDQQAQLSAEGYNDANATVKASNDKIQSNNFNLTPVGKVYFLSKLSGKIDVVKTDLDGKNRETVLAGTGKEDQRNTVLLASRDWKHLALLSRRAGNNPSLYLINTADDSLTTIDSGNVSFTLVGWVGDNFVYTVTRDDVSLWQNGRQIIKSFNAQTKKSQTLDQTTATGTGNFDYVSELIGNVYAYENQVYYIKNWTGAFNDSSEAQIAVKQATFNSVKPDGSAKKAIRSFGLTAGTQAADVTVDAKVKTPNAFELHFANGVKDIFYTYANGQVKDDSSMTVEGFYGANYPTYLLSPSGNNTFWSEPRDGKNTLFIGDEDGHGSKQIATLSDFDTYGWYTDDYLLVSKNSSELYIMDNQAKQTPVKISDYHKPAVTFAGYGGGYGGL